MKAKVLFWHQEQKWGVAEVVDTTEEVFFSGNQVYGEMKIPLQVGTLLSIDRIRAPKANGRRREACGIVAC